MESARAHFAALGFAVKDVSANASFDLLCTRADRVLDVEVKGTTGGPESVLITAAEARRAVGRYPDIALYVVSGIDLVGRNSLDPVASGGSVRVLDPWDVRACRVEPVTLRCYLPTAQDNSQLSLQLPGGPDLV